MRKSLFVGSLLLASLCASPAQAQILLKAGRPASIAKKIDQEKWQKEFADFRLRYPWLTSMKMPQKPKEETFARAPKAHAPYKAPEVKKAPRLLAPAALKTVLWGNQVYGRDWLLDDFNYQSFSTTAPITTTRIGSTSGMFNAGCGFVNGELYGIFLDTSWMSYGYIGITKMHYKGTDADEWEAADDNNTDLHDRYDLVAIETAQAADGTIYGEFYNAYATGAEYGVIDYVHDTRTTIGPATKQMVAMGITSDNRLYGVAKDGHLYEINTSTGEETDIGRTGVTNIVNDNGQYVVQGGEIDPKTNTFYWEAIDINSQYATLYTVDLATGRATEIGEIPDGFMTGILVQPALAANAAPAAATDVTASFPNGKTAGTVTFTAPTTTYGGEALEGQLAYTVSVGDKVIGSGTTQAGQVTVAQIDDAPEGNDRICVTTTNGEGESPKAKIWYYVGYDTPLAPANVKVDVNADGTVSISWDAVTAGLHDGFLGNVSYDVERYTGDKGSEVIASGLAATSATDHVATDSMHYYVYGVRAHNTGDGHDLVSAYGESDGTVFGKAFEVPYFEPFNSLGAFNLFGVIDVNNDGSTWKYNEETQDAEYIYDNYNNANDWLVSPDIHLEANRNYLVSFKARAVNPNYPEKLEVRYGQGRTASKLNRNLVRVTELKTNKWTTFTQEIHITSDGKYNFGFHARSDRDAYRLAVDSIVIEMGALPTAPDSVSNIVITPDAEGELGATISFSAPDRTAERKPLASVDSVVVFNGNRKVGVVDALEAGATGTLVDNAPDNGVNHYSFVAYNASGAGRKNEAEHFIGVDYALPPENVVLQDNSSNITLTWNPITTQGANGGYVNPNKTTTELYNLDLYGTSTFQRGSLCATSAPNATSLVYDFNSDEGKPGFKYWSLVNKNVAGESLPTNLTMIVGKPETIKYYEDFDEDVSTKQYHPMWIEVDSAAEWMVNSNFSLKTGGASAYVYAEKGDGGTLNTYKLTLGGVAHPELIFYDYSLQNTAGTFSILVQKRNGETTEVYNEDIYDEQPFTQHKVDLTEFTNEPWIIIKFRFESTATSRMGFDKLIIQDVKDNDLEATLTTQTDVYKGQNINAVVNVNNIGDNDVSKYKISIYDGDKLVTEREVNHELLSFDDSTFVFAVPSSSVDASAVKNVRAVVTLEGDEDLSNNEARSAVGLKDNDDVPTVGNLTLDNQDPTFKLDWTEPVDVSSEVTEGFETYEPFVTPYGRWTTIDGNPVGQASALFLGYDYPGQGTATTFILFNPDKVFGAGNYDADQLGGHNYSSQYLLAPWERDRSHSEWVDVDADNYLVSPQLTGEAQDISFYVRNGYDGEFHIDFPERFNIIVSKTGNSLENFTDTILADTTITGHVWQRIEASLPEGTMYFAIHQNSLKSKHDTSGNYIFSLDDITYRVGAGKAVKYNVYRNGELAGTVEAGTLTFSDIVSKPGNYNYAVTAVYVDGRESKPVTVATTGIGSIVSSGRTFDVYDLGGILVRKNATTTQGLLPGAYIINGQKVLINNRNH